MNKLINDIFGSKIIVLFNRFKNQFLVKIIPLNIILLLSFVPIANCQLPTDSLNTLQLTTNNSQLKISILTCGSGEDLYSVYGHSAIRVVDSLRGTDVVYNYGTFNFGDPDFYMKFTRGKLDYYVNDEQYEGFVSMYQQDGRSVYEQVLELNSTDANAINDFLINNLKEENKYYKYDFLFDNCSTRLRDIFTKTFGKKLNCIFTLNSLRI